MTPVNRHLSLGRSVGFAVVLLVILLAVNLILSPARFQPGSWGALLGLAAPLIGAAIASTPVILAGRGGIDISVGPLMGFVNAFAIQVLFLGAGISSPLVLVPAALLVGALVGAANGFLADGFRLPLDKLVEAGLPAIVLITEQGYNHFVVIKGFEAGRVLLGDPSGGTRSLPRARFEAVWPTRLLFVIHTAPGEPRFNLADDWRAAPHAPLADAVARTARGGVDLPKFGPGDF